MNAGGNLAELHFHALADLDDGPGSIAQSVALVSAAAAGGVTTVVATPHVREDFVTDVAAIGDHVEELRAALAAAQVNVELHAGGEVGHGLVGRLSQAELEALAQGPRGARWILLEMPFEPLGDAFHDAAQELRERGFGIVLAHPERSADVTLDAGAGLRRELAASALIQVNAGSLTGLHGEQARQAAFGLIDAGLVAVVSSDAHGPTRPPLLREAYAGLLERGVGRVEATRLIGFGPRRLLAAGILLPLAA